MRKDLPSFWNAPALRASGWRFLRRPGLLPSTSATCCLLSGVLCSSAAWWGNTADAFVSCAWFSSWLQLVFVSCWLLSAAWLCTDEWGSSGDQRRWRGAATITGLLVLSTSIVARWWVLSFSQSNAQLQGISSGFPPSHQRENNTQYSVTSLSELKLGLHAQCPNRVKLIARQKRQQFLHFQHTTIFFGTT